MMGVHAPESRPESLRPWWDAARLQASCDLLRPVHDPRISLSFLLPFRALLAIFFFLSGSIVYWHLLSGWQVLPFGHWSRRWTKSNRGCFSPQWRTSPPLRSSLLYRA